MSYRIVRTQAPPKVLPKVRIIRSSEWFSIHTHSKYSANDAMTAVKDLVARAKELGYPALGLTDHGNIAGTVELYQSCREAGIKPLPGTELYVVQDRQDKHAKRYHMGVLAFTTEGYRNLVHLSTLSHRNFHHKPLVDLADLARLAGEGRLKGLAVTTGCFFGMVTQTLINSGREPAKALVAALSKWFDKCYVEVQRHNIDQEPLTEEEISAELIGIADELGLHIVTTQDSHYLLPEEQEHHNTWKSLVTWSDDASEAQFPGDGFHLADEQWIKDHHGPETHQRGIDGLKDLLADYDLLIPEMETYSYKVPNNYQDPGVALESAVTAALETAGLNTPRYRKRLGEELYVIEHTGMAAYLLLVAKVTAWLRDRHIFYQCRGSASGSLVCYLLQITSLDPLKWGLLMDRFLSMDRTKPPDVDIDVDKERRGEVIEWLSESFATSQIGTWTTYSMKGDKGSLIVKARARMAKEGRKEEKLSNEDFERIEHLSDLKLFSNYGVHPAGMILCSTDAELEQMVPRMWVASSKTLVSQYDMHNIEAIGLVKLDVLGLKTLHVLRRAIENMGRNPSDGLDFIPLTDTKCLKPMAKGETTGVFQLEGWTSTQGMRSLKPSSVKDVIAAMALFRPATMNSGATDDYIKRKHRERLVPTRHPIIMEATKKTHGVMLYQEQVIAVLKALGLNPDELTKFLKAVKASNGNIGDAAGVIRGMMTDIKRRCAEAGMSETDVRWLEQALEAYSGYGFNEAHATMYGITAYRCAYLAEHHTVPFFAALLSAEAGEEKETEYISAARARGVPVRSPDVNESGVNYRISSSGNYIRKSLTSIKGVGDKAALAIEEAQPFTDLDDFLARCNPSVVTGIKPLQTYLKKHGQLPDPDDMVGVVKHLYQHGALRPLMKEN